MSDPFVAEIRMFAGNFAPSGWMFCEGQTLPISENEVLFQLIGTTYGGDGQATFNLPNLASRVPIHMGTAPSGTTYLIGEMAGTETVTLTTQQIPNHTHPAQCSSGNQATTTDPTNSVAAPSDLTQYISGGASVFLGNGIQTTPAGGSQPHDNLIPFLCINYIISLFGVFPSQT